MSKNRRDFLKSTSVGLGTAALSSASFARAGGANERVTVGIIGCGGMGSNHLRLLTGNKRAQVGFVCDVDEQRVGRAMKTAAREGNKLRPTGDLRKVLDDKSVDAVWVATPDHWHAAATLLALEAGKHVYVEKPCSHNIREGRLMVDAAARHKKIVQVGTQSRSTTQVKAAIDLLKDGAIGDILVAKAWNSQKRRNIGKSKPSKPPAHLDFDMWVGPAPQVPYQRNLLHYHWHWWYDFGTGDMGNDGVHDLDIARWGLGVDEHPSTVTALGGKYFFDDDQQFPDTQYVVFEYPGDGKVGQKRQLVFEQRIWSPYPQEGHSNGNAFYGTKGVLILGKSGGWQLYGARNKLLKSMRGGPDVRAHHADFLDCIGNNKTPNASIEIHHLSSSLCHLGNIATRLGRSLAFESDKEQFRDDPQADALVGREYRKGHWAVPKGV